MEKHSIGIFLTTLSLAALIAAGYIYWSGNSTTDTTVNESITPTSTSEENLVNKKAIQTSKENIVSEPDDSATDENIAADDTNGSVTDNSDFNSCSVEATILCNGLRDGKLALVDCLLNDHYDELSEACRGSLERRQTLNEELVAACSADRGKFCRGVEPQPGREPMVDCLEAHYSELSAECAAAFDAHDAAKPTQ